VSQPRFPEYQGLAVSEAERVSLDEVADSSHQNCVPVRSCP
jgi:hypothetical protein